MSPQACITQHGRWCLASALLPGCPSLAQGAHRIALSPAPTTGLQRACEVLSKCSVNEWVSRVFNRTLFLCLLSNHQPAILHLQCHELCFLMATLRSEETECESGKAGCLLQARNHPHLPRRAAHLPHLRPFYFGLNEPDIQGNIWFTPISAVCFLGLYE